MGRELQGQEQGHKEQELRGREQVCKHSGGRMLVEHMQLR